MRYCVLAVMLIGSVGQLYAAESGPRAYKNVPADINVLQLYYKTSETKGALLNLKSDAELLRYFHYFDFFGNIAVIGGYFPYANATLSIPAFGLTQSVSGMADPVFVFGFDFYGAPLLSIDEYNVWEQKTILGFSLQVSAPLGEYDKTSALNLGLNRWMFRPELAASHQLGTSGLYVESYLNYHFFTKNREYLGNLVRDQNGKWGVDAHLSYEFMRGSFVSLDYLHAWGGETIINGILQGDAIRTTTIGTTLKLTFSKSMAVEFKYRDDLDTKNSDKTRSFLMKLQYLW